MVFAMQLATSHVDVRNESFSFVDHYARVEDPHHRDGVKLLDYWQTCIAKGDGFVVGRDIPARPIASLLRSISIYEPLPAESDMRVRLAGEMAARRFNCDIKGRLMSEIFPEEDFEHHLDVSFEALHTGEPIVLDSRLEFRGIEKLHSEALLLPVTAPDLKTPWLLVGLFYFG